MANSANSVNGVQEGFEAVQPYSMHVSSRYLELTRKKLQLARLPGEPKTPEDRRWEQGVPKALLEPLLDYWLEQYDWRSQEAHFNSTLPQFRTNVHLTITPSHAPTPPPLRIHFVHKRSKHKNAIPLLFCHTWPSSFVEIQKIISALTDPHSLPSFGAGAQQAFHVVAPSIPGFGFSDASPNADFGLKETADVFHKVMERLGYERYVVHGSGWGFNICRALALGQPQSCLAIHTSNPSFKEPDFKQSPMTCLKYRIAQLVRAKVTFLSFGYVPAELHISTLTPVSRESELPSGPLETFSLQYTLRPQTLSYSLCDSPIGLLACILDTIHTRSLPTPLPPQPRSPFLSPAEIEMTEERPGVPAHDNDVHSPATERPEMPLSPRESELRAMNYSWSPTEVLNWTMLQWLPGPEASLRWLRQACLETHPSSLLSTTYSPIPLGISSFLARNSSSAATSPLMWGSATSNISWIKRHQRPAALPAWEAPDLLVLDMRECFGSFLDRGIIANLPGRET
ncbi:alpha/beta-hydrolase [Lindgomyces ingoldianus]|uniref:Alpha/beta-hydrolase n=1 Tax=Lindgomyces ingoldianus TaxID=673940 RepID=A0ACB6QE92_9PLEO|nr:alpha/beta-hydrolase [Lindgomyces ingoldianus]KAF2465241.1 alpha/beta-hydrolase [Lindgomyces ingoldianus]